MREYRTQNHFAITRTKVKEVLDIMDVIEAFQDK